MEKFEKLKLLRGLYCVSQDEMAILAKKCHRSIYSAVETKDAKRKLTADQTTAIYNALGFGIDWFAGDVTLPLQEYRFLFIDMDWSRRHMAVTENIRQRRINDAVRSVELFLPKMLEENAPIQCWIALTAKKKRLIFFQFNNQFLLLRIVPGQPISKKIVEISRSPGMQLKAVKLKNSEFDRISKFDEDALFAFLKQCKLDSESFALCQSSIKGQSNNRFDYSKVFGSELRQTVLDKICQDMRHHGITPDEVIKAYNAAG